MKIHEYQAKEILSRFKVPIPKGSTASTPQQARDIARSLGGKVVVKAQVHAGGRGKAGGVKVVSSPEEAEQVAASLLNRNLVTFQTGPEGVPVRKVLVEEAMDIERELYLGVVIDERARGAVVMASEAGGIEIEEVAATSPEKILRVTVDPSVGFQPFQGRKLAYCFFITLLGIIIDWAYFELTWDTHFGKSAVWIPAMSQALQFVWLLLPMVMIFLVNAALSYSYLKLERRQAIIFGAVMGVFTAPWLLPTLPYVWGWVG